MLAAIAAGCSKAFIGAYGNAVYVLNDAEGLAFGQPFGPVLAVVLLILAVFSIGRPFNIA